jgi:hypothetical protein
MEFVNISIEELQRLKRQLNCFRAVKSLIVPFDFEGEMMEDRELFIDFIERLKKIIDEVEW